MIVRTKTFKSHWQLMLFVVVGTLVIVGCQLTRPTPSISEGTLETTMQTRTVTSTLPRGDDINHVATTSTPVVEKVTALPSISPTISPTPSMTSTAVKAPTETPTHLLPVMQKIGDLKMDGYRLATSLEEQLLATSNVSGTVHVIDTITGNTRRLQDRLFTFMIGDKTLSFSSDETLLAAGGGEGTVFVWDTQNGKLVHSFPFGVEIQKVSFSSNGRLLAASSMDIESQHGKGIIIWNVLTGNIEYTFPSPDVFVLTTNGEVPVSWQIFDAVLDVTFAPKNNVLAIATSQLYASNNSDIGVVLLWDLENSQLQTVFYGKEAQAVSFSPDGMYLAAVVDGHLRLWDFQQNQEVELPAKDLEPFVQKFIFSQTGYIAILSWGGSVELWDIRSGYLTRINEDTIVSDIGFTPREHLLVARFSANPIEEWEITSQSK
ncbi:MAG: hypothetical protein GWP17_02160 [Aquificales bacterium]|nr:hypothetical protein [Aquificales bacterium]